MDYTPPHHRTTATLDLAARNGPVLKSGDARCMGLPRPDALTTAAPAAPATGTRGIAWALAATRGTRLSCGVTPASAVKHGAEPGVGSQDRIARSQKLPFGLCDRPSASPVDQQQVAADLGCQSNCLRLAEESLTTITPSPDRETSQGPLRNRRRRSAAGCACSRGGAGSRHGPCPRTRSPARA